MRRPWPRVSCPCVAQKCFPSPASSEFGWHSTPGARATTQRGLPCVARFRRHWRCCVRYLGWRWRGRFRRCGLVRKELLCVHSKLGSCRGVALQRAHWVAAVIAAPTLLLFFIGLLDAAQLRDEKARWQLLLLAGALVTHYVLLNSLAVFPRGWYGLPNGHAIAAANARNYTPSAPIATLFVALGVAALVNAIQRQNRARFAISASIAALVTAYAIAWGGMVTGPLRVLDLSLLTLTLVVLLLTLRVRLRCEPYTIWKFAALVTLGSSFLIRPFFWYPTRWNDRRAESIEALSTMVRKEDPARVIQDLASALGTFADPAGVDATWTYPHDFSRRLDEAPLNTIVVSSSMQTASHCRAIPRNSAPGFQVRSSHSDLNSRSSAALTRPFSPLAHAR